MPCIYLPWFTYLPFVLGFIVLEPSKPVFFQTKDFLLLQKRHKFFFISLTLQLRIMYNLLILISLLRT